MLLGKEISTLLQSSQMQATAMTPEQADELRHKVVQVFTTKHKPWHTWIWEDLTQSYAIQKVRGYLWIAEFLENKVSILLFNPGDEPTVYSFADGAELVQMIDDLPRTEFYVTDEAYQFLLCYNHHDYLIACGTALPWLEKRAPFPQNLTE